MNINPRQYWEKVPPKYRQWTIYGAALGGLLVLCYMFVNSWGTRQPGTQDDKTVKRELFTPQRLEQKFGVPGLAREIEDLKKQVQDLKNMLAQGGGKPEQDKDKKALQEKVDQLTKQLEGLQKKEHQKGQEEKTPPPGAPRPAMAKGPPPQGDKSKLPDWLPGQAKTENKPASPAKSPGSPLGIPQVAKEIRRTTAASSGREGEDGKTDVVRTVKKEKGKDDKGIFIPAGSIFSGTLLTGMDAPCGEGAKKDPFPVLLRVKEEAILPNRYTADVRECFLIASGYGDLSSERAYLRAERLSCIRQDGQALETQIEMYASGEDGKAGVRGRLVNKAGTVISRALLVGFMEGFSKMFGKTPVLTINAPQGNVPAATPFQRNLSRDSMEAAGIAGVGNALDRLAKYYLDMAENMFPIVEIDAGRKLDFVLTKGASLKLQGSRL